MKILIFDNYITGHHIEYLNYIYKFAIEDSNNNYIFYVPEEFKFKKKNYCWPRGENIEFKFLNTKQIEKIKGNKIKISWNISKLLGQIQKKENANYIILINLAHFIPFLPIFIRKTKVRGIIYKIYLYNKLSKLDIIKNFIRYKIMSICKIYDKTFILNDTKSTNTLNKIYRTTKFFYLPDPVPDISKYKLKDLRNELGIKKEKKIFLHIGSLDKRKGTLEILKAIKLLKDPTYNHFIFAGKINTNIKDKFDVLVADIRKSSKCNKIHIIDEFINEELMHNLYFTSDYILIPYLETSQSSGILGYAAAFEKKVIGPDSGLIGNIINSFNLGWVLPQITPEEIAKSIKMIKLENRSKSDYVISHSITDFCNTLLKIDEKYFKNK